MVKELYTMSESDIRMMVRAKIAERLNEGGEFTPHGYKTMSNSGAPRWR